MSHNPCADARPVYLAAPPRTLPWPAVASAVVVLYFFHFTVVGLLADFSHDDLMNLTFAWRYPASQHVRDIVLFFLPSATFRPVGSLFYWAMFELFGFTPAPYRVVCFAILLANSWLAWRLARRLTGSWVGALTATMIFAYHGNFWPLYLSTGFCYDIFCFFFYAAGFLSFLRLREQGIPGWRGTAAWCAIYILCLGTKEMAVSLPVVMLGWELLEHPPKAWRWLWREGRVPLIGGAMTAAYLWGRMRGPGALSNVEAYRIELRPAIFLDRTGRLLSEWFYDPHPYWVVAAALVLIAVPFFVRAKGLRLSLLWRVAGVLPIAFIAPRGLAQAYVPAFGMALFAASLMRRLSGNSLWAGAVPLALLAWHTSYGTLDAHASLAEGARIRVVWDQLESLAPSIPEHGNVLILDDPFPGNDWASTFLVYLYSRQPGASVAPLRVWQREADQEERAGFQTVLSYAGGNLIECDARPFHHVKIRDLAATRCDPTGIAHP